MLTAAGLASCEPALQPTPASVQPQAPVSIGVDEELNARLIGFKNRLQRDPYAADVRLAFGQALLERGDIRAAEEEVSKALELGLDKNLALPALAGIWNLLGRSKELLQAHSDTRLTDPKASAELKTALATALSVTGDTKGARAMAAAALADDPRSMPARLMQARHRAGSGEVEAALKAVEALLNESPKSAEAWQTKAELLRIGKGDLASAIAAFEKALDVEPRFLPAHAALISAALAENDVEAAQTHLNRQAKHFPGHAQTRYFTARIAEAKGDLATTRTIAQRLLVDHPTDLRYLMLAAGVELRGGSLRTAEELLSRALTIGPTVPRTRHLLAQAYLRLAAPEKAQTVLEPLVRRSPPDATALGLAAEAALQAGNPRVANRLFEQALAADPGNPRVRTALALSRIARGDLGAGLGELESIAKADHTSLGDMALLSARLHVGDLAAATRAAERVAAKAPKSPMPQWILGRLSLRAGKPDAARPHFERALELDRTYVPAALALAEFDLKAKDPKLAAQRFQGVLASNPKQPDAVLALAEINRRSGASAHSVAAALEAATRIHPTNAKVWLALVNHLIQSGDGPAALLAAQSAMGAVPESPLVADAMGRAQVAAGETAQALTTFRKIASDRPRSPEPLLRMAEVHLRRGETDSALEAVRSAARVRPDHPQVVTLLVTLTTAKQNWAEATAIAKRAQARYPKAALGFTLEGHILASQEKWEPALVAFRAAAKRGETADLGMRIHSVLRAAGRTEEASAFLTQWIEKYPKDTRFMSMQADLALRRGEWSAAEKLYLLVLGLEPESADAMNNLAWAMIEQNKAAATDLARRAVRMRPDRADFMDTLSMALAKDKKLTEAIANQKKAVALAPDEPMLQLNLARLALEVSDHSLAREQLDKLSALGNKFPAQSEVYKLRRRLPG